MRRCQAESRGLGELRCGVRAITISESWTRCEVTVLSVLVEVVDASPDLSREKKSLRGLDSKFEFELGQSDYSVQECECARW